MSDLDGEPLRIRLILATSDGGVGRHVRALARAFCDAGHDVVVLGPAATQKRFAFSQPGDRVQFAAVEIASGLRPIAAARAAATLSKLVRDCDVVDAHGLRAGVVTAVAFRRRVRGRDRPAFVVTLHNAILGSPIRRRVLGFVQARLARSASAVQAVSPDLVEGLRSTRPDAERALVTSTLAPPTNDAADTRAAMGVAEGAPLVLAIGRLHLQKGFDVLIDAAALLADMAPRPVFVVAGEGPLRAELETRIARQAVDVRLIGDRADIPDLVQAAAVVVMPSRWEGWPLAAVEVLGAGRPLIASAVGGLPELVGDGGLLVPPGSPGALAGALRRVLGDSAVAAALGAAGVARSAELPTPADVTSSVLAVYRRAIAGSVSR